MFTAPTVFVLGAGASWHYGYPTGEALVKLIVEKGRLLEQYLEFSMASSNEVKPLHLAGYSFDGIDSSKQWRSALLDCRELTEGLEQVNPLVIDYYLGWNIHLEKIGKLLIAWAILDCERGGLESLANINRPRPRGTIAQSRDDWCRFIVHQLAIDCVESKDLLKNRVSFITFNYDVSLETTLHQNLRHIKLFKEEDVDRFLAGTRVNHVYGMVPLTALGARPDRRCDGH